MISDTQTDDIDTDILFKHCEIGEMSLLSIALQSNKSVLFSINDISGQSLLDVAIRNKQRAVADLLVKSGFPVESKLSATLSLATSSGLYDIVKSLLGVIPTVSAADAKACLAIACEHGFRDIARLLASTPDVDLTQPFHLACVNGHSDIVNDMLSAGFNVSDPRLDRYETVISAASNGHSEIVNTLIKSGPPINLHSEYLFYDAVGGGCDGLVKHILSQVDHDETTLWRALPEAAKNGHIDVIKTLLSALRAETVRTCPHDLTESLSRALNNGHVNATQVLIDSGADLNKSTMFDRTMLISAAKGGCVEFVRMMIDAGTIDVNTKDKFKRTALSEASDPTIVRLLLSAKADTSLGPALNMSAQNHQPASVKMLLDAGADVNCMIVYHTPLCTAVSTQCEDEKIDDKIAVINLLVDAGASLLRVDRISNSALQICITKWPAQPRVAAALLARDPTLLELRDGTGKTPLQVAVTIKSVEMVRFLISAGADVHKCDKFGVPIVSLAMRRPSYSPTSRTLDTLLLMRETLDVLLAAGADPTACDANGKTAVMEALSPMETLSLDCIIPEESCTRFIAYFSEAILRRVASM